MNPSLAALVLVVFLLVAILVSSYLALKRADIPFPALQARYETADSLYLTLPHGVRLHYRDDGDVAAPALLLLHGFSASLETWGAWSEALSRSHRVISIDLPGHGLTETPKHYDASVAAACDLIEAFAQAQGLERFAIGGNSLGGHIALSYTLKHPQRVAALLLVDAAGWQAKHAGAKRASFAFKLLRRPAIGRLISDLASGALIQAIVRRSYADPARITDAMMKRYFDLSRAPGHRDAMLKLMLDGFTGQTLSQETLAPIASPTLILWGERDNIIPLANAHAFHSAIKGSELVVHPNVGHFPQEESAHTSATAVSQFLLRVHPAD